MKYSQKQPKYFYSVFWEFSDRKSALLQSQGAMRKYFRIQTLFGVIWILDVSKSLKFANETFRAFFMQMFRPESKIVLKIKLFFLFSTWDGTSSKRQRAWKLQSFAVKVPWEC